MTAPLIESTSTPPPRARSVSWWAIAGCIGATLQLLGGVLESLDRTGPGEPGYQLRTGVIGLAYLLLTGTAVALERTEASGRSPAGRIGLILTSAGWVLSCVAQFVLSVRFEVAEQVLFPIATTMIGVGMIVAGLAIVRARRWRGWPRWIPLTCGLFPFLVLFPSFAATGSPNFAVLAGWGGCWLATGLAAVQHSRPRSSRDEPV